MILLSGVPYVALAQDQQQQTAAPTPAQQLLSADQLDQIVAPIALYPDTLLAEVLMASTYPLEVVEADRWSSANKNLKGDALKAAADKQDWDGSIKSLVATPSVLSMMSTQLDWTRKLGDAVLAQQPDVMDAIQRLRAKAQAENKLQTTKQQTVSTQQQNGKQVIVITPTDPNTIYVPYYNPASGRICCRCGDRHGCGVWGWLCRRTLGLWGQLLGWRLQLGQQQHQRQSQCQRQQLAAQFLSSPRRGL